MPQFILTPDCKRLMADAGVTEADLLGGDGQTCSSFARDVSRMTMARWRPGDRIILIDGPIKNSLRFGSFIFRDCDSCETTLIAIPLLNDRRGRRPQGP